METSYIITFIGDDRPGLVEQLSSVIEKNQGNWHESRLSQLAGKFAGLISISLPTASGDALREDLKALSSSGLSVRVTPAIAASASADGATISLSVLGPDRLGIVREISRALTQHQINVVEMESVVESAPMSGEALFRANISAQIIKGTDMVELQEKLDEIANEMTLDIDLD